jgi:hypothetical protein
MARLFVSALEQLQLGGRNHAVDVIGGDSHVRESPRALTWLVAASGEAYARADQLLDTKSKEGDKWLFR